MLHALFYCKRKKRKKSSGPDFRPDGQGQGQGQGSYWSVPYFPRLISDFPHTLLLSFFFFTPKLSPRFESWIFFFYRPITLFLSLAFRLRRCRNGEEVRERERASLAVRRAGCAIGVHSRLRRSTTSGRSPLLRSPLWSHLRHRRRA